MRRAAALAAIAVVLAGGGLRAASATDAGRLPEDPAAGKKSEAQWRAHMQAEEHERQLGYDSRKLKEHRAVLKVLRSARARYDRARTPATVAKARAAVQPMLDAARKQVTAIDHWRVNSALLGDYDAVIAALAGPYPDARLAALGGDTAALDALRADLDRRAKKMAAWLTEAAASQDE